MDSKFLWLERDVVKAGTLQTFLADWTVVVCPEPEVDTILAELVTTNCQNSKCEVFSADDTETLVSVLGIHFLEMENCKTLAYGRVHRCLWDVVHGFLRTFNRGGKTPWQSFTVKRLVIDYLVADSEEHKEFRLGDARKSSVDRPMLAGQKPNPAYQGAGRGEGGFGC